MPEQIAPNLSELRLDLENLGEHILKVLYQHHPRLRVAWDDWEVLGTFMDPIWGQWYANGRPPALTEDGRVDHSESTGSEMLRWALTARSPRGWSDDLDDIAPEQNDASSDSSA